MSRKLIQVAVALLAGISVNAVIAQDTGEVTVQASRVVKKVIGTTSSGIPIEDISLSYGVSTNGLDLTSSAGAAELQKLVAAAATGIYSHFAGEVSTDDAQVDAHNAPIAPKISGNISEVLVEDNQIVKAGQALVRIDPRDYQAKVDQARAALAMAQSDSLGAHANVPLTNETTLSAVSSAEGRLAAAEADNEKEIGRAHV